MNIKELTFEEFKNFSSTHPLGNFHQTLEYALLRAEEGYDYELIGYKENENILAASLILTKKIGTTHYGYAPRGFLIDYSNRFFLTTFTNQLREYYRKKGLTFIKINPEIAIGKLNKNTQNMEYNTNYPIIDDLLACGYKKLKNNMYFEALLPRYNAIVSLKDFNINNLNKNTRNKIKKGIRKGLTLCKVEFDKFDILYNFIKNKRNKDEFYYKDLFNVFNKKESVDLFLIKVDFKDYLIRTQNKYNNELNRNNTLNNKIINHSATTVINSKMSSDKNLLTYKNDIAEASKFLNKDDELYIAGALVIKYDNRITIQISGYDKTYKRFVPNYFLYFAILDYYKDKFQYADLNGITADLTKENPYHGLNEFKLGFNPEIYEYIGEFDLIINEQNYNKLLKTGLLAKEFNKTD